ncbi:MAG: 2-phosphosulfolactate phosphatase [bacterium]|nr:MAG: 2-phosphosulfolactate phosphatase [bacterium]
MRIRYYPTFEQADREVLQDSVVVVIDVLRATSTILAGLDRGATRIIPVEDIETATRLVGPTDRGTKLLVGERKGMPIDGFNLFNSPSEFTPESVTGKTLIITTSNGTRAITATRNARRSIVCSLNNVGAVAGAVRDEKELIVLCSGNEGMLAAEDLLCGGMLLKELSDEVDCDSLDDAARLSMLLAETFEYALKRFIMSCDRGRALIALGYEEDVVYCATRDRSSRVPEFKQGAILG